MKPSVQKTFDLKSAEPISMEGYGLQPVQKTNTRNGALAPEGCLFSRLTWLSSISPQSPKPRQPFRLSQLATLAILILLPLCGCKSYWVQATVENQTGHPLHELEVDYPSASFGINTLAAGASSHYRFTIRGNGPVKVQYTLDTGNVINAQGPKLSEHQQGTLTLRLLPTGKVDFLPNLQPAS